MFCYTARQHQAAEIVAAKTGLRPLAETLEALVSL